MLSQTHYTVQGYTTTVLVKRIADSVHVGTITQLEQGGWEANHGGGVRIVHTTKVEAFEAIAAADLAVGAQRKQR